MGENAQQVEGQDGERRIAIVDGSNVAYGGEDEPRLANIQAVCDKLREEGFKPIVLVDAALRHQIDRPADYEKMVDAGEIRQAPAGTDADYFILSFAREMEARIVTNDRYRDHEQEYAEEIDRVMRFMIVDGEVVFERRAHRRG